jgi:glycosyltransferase involved in cell wall biosynthesis
LLLSVEPPVFLTGIPYDDYLGVARTFAEKFGNVDAGFIVFPTWSLEQRGLARAVKERHADHTARFPRHVFRFICNTVREAELLQEQELPAEFLNKNFMVSDSIFRPLPEVQVEFDAIYNARFVPDKRHELATLIPRVGYVAYVEPEAHRVAEFSTIYGATLARSPRHVLLNEMHDGRPVPMTHDRVNAAQARGAVGLVLSAVEGSSYCSMEYLLAGLPVVSTPSLGGRDVYFDPEFCIVCPPDRAAVRDAVLELKARKIPREVVRLRTLDKIAPKRARFLELIDEVLHELDAPRRFAGRPWRHAGSGVRWGYYTSHLEVFVQAKRSELARKVGLASVKP